MKDYLNFINEFYPIRRTKKEKEAFRNYVLEEAKTTNYEVEIETLDNKYNNIIIGNLEEAKIIFTAHYDTPATSIIPNLMMPRNKLLTMIYHLGIPIILSLLCLLIASLIASFMSVEMRYTIMLYLILYLCSYYILFRCFKNKNNKNDNTSGVSFILSLISECDKKDIAFVLFDDEEKGLLGSKAFSKKHKDILKEKLIINFDCVGNGNNMIFISKKGAEKHKLFNKLNETIKSNNEFNVLFYSIDGSISNSDYKNFDNGISVMACKKHKNIYYTNKIHTNKDTEASTKNINFLVENIMNFINEEL